MHKGRKSGGAYALCIGQMGALENAKIMQKKKFFSQTFCRVFIQSI